MSDVVINAGEPINVSVTQAPQQSTIVIPTPTTSVSVRGVIGGGGDAHYVHLQNTPSASWTVTHNLNKRPAVVVVDSAESVVIGEVTYNSDNQVTLTFAGAFSGKAYFN